LHGIVHREIVDADHADLQARHHLIQISSAGPEDRRAEAVRRVVGDLHGVVEGRGAHEDEDGREELLARDAHRRRDVDEEGGGEIVAFGVDGVVEALAADEETGALLHGFGDEAFESGEGGVGDHGADVDVVVVVVIIQRGAETEGADPRFDEGDEPVVDGGTGHDALDADAVLAGGLEDAAHEDAGDAGQVRDVVEDDGGVLAAEFDAHGRQGLGGGGADVVRHGPAADEGDVAEGWVGGEGWGDGGPAGDGLHEGGGVVAGFERAVHDRDKVSARPGRGFGAFDDDGVAAEEGGDDGAEQVVELRATSVTSLQGRWTATGRTGLQGS